MKLEYIVAIGVRLFAIGLGVNVLRSLSLIPAYLSGTTTHAELLPFYGSTIALALLVLVLWNFPLLVARKISSFPQQEESVLNDDAYIKLLEIGLILLGFYLLYYVISDGVYWFIYFLSASKNEYYDSVDSVGPDQVANMLTTIVELVVASFLLLGHKGLARLVLKLRRA